jgi:hypothetical protein
MVTLPMPLPLEPMPPVRVVMPNVAGVAEVLLDEPMTRALVKEPATEL